MLLKHRCKSGENNDTPGPSDTLAIPICSNLFLGPGPQIDPEWETLLPHSFLFPSFLFLSSFFPFPFLLFSFPLSCLFLFSSSVLSFHRFPFLPFLAQIRSSITWISTKPCGNRPPEKPYLFSTKIRQGVLTVAHLSSYVLYYNVILHYYITTCFLCILVRIQFSQRSERRNSRQRVWSWRTVARIWIVAMLIWTSERWGEWSWPRGRTFVVELVYMCLYNIEHVTTHADVTYGYIWIDVYL